MVKALRLPALLLAASALSFPASAASPPSVWVTIPPQAWVVDQLAGDLVQVHVLVGPGQSHHTFEPGPRQIAALQGADLYLRLGASSEDLLMRRLGSVAGDLQIVDGSRGIQLLPMSNSVAGGDHGHGSGLPDPHYWLDPALMAIHAANACEALSRLLPQHAAELRSRLDTLRDVLGAADREVSARLQPYAGRSILVYHPAFGYFTRRYGLVQVAVEVEGKEPTARQLAELVALTDRIDANTVFLQPQFAGRAPQALAEAIGATLVLLNPLARDYTANLETMAARIAAALGEKR